jgi:hypothetical protein
MSDKPPKRRRTLIPQMADYENWLAGSAVIRFPRPIKSNPELEERFKHAMLAAVNRALYDFSRGSGQ